MIHIRISLVFILLLDIEMLTIVLNFNIYEDICHANVGHFGHGHFGLGRFGPDISATDVSATENAKGGRFGQVINFELGCVHA